MPLSINEENSATFDRRVSPLVGAATHESNVWVLSVKGRKIRKINCISFGFRAYIKQSYSNNDF
jgi:mRNA-degrading endonuclease HigB of HigAB toxin-antitoxin module